MNYGKSDVVLHYRASICTHLYIQKICTKIYQGNYICNEYYIVNTEVNVITRWGGDDNPAHDSEPVIH